jgi:hypothetical protein
MSKLSILQKNAYLTIVIKDNGMWAHLAYTDHNAAREYILSDFTDLTPLRYRLDDDTFTKDFWLEYFQNLEKALNWNLLSSSKDSIFTFSPFKKEGEGVSGVRVEIDDNQRFFDKIFASVRSFSKDIALRVVDDLYVQKMLNGLIEKTEYEDIIYIDMDLLDFSVFRITRRYDKKSKKDINIFSKAKINWKDEISLIDSIRDSRFKAFLATELSNKEILNYWSNFVLNRVLYSEDPNLVDILRGYSTIQSHSIFRDNKEKVENFGLSKGESAVIVSGYIPRILGQSKTLLSIIDGLELIGKFDCFWDLDMKLLAYGKSYTQGINAMDIILTRKEVFSLASRVVIPHTKAQKKSKVIFSGSIESLGSERSEIFALSSEYTYVKFPEHSQKLVVEGELKNGAIGQPHGFKTIGFVSNPETKKYESLLIDGRPRPVVYGPDSYSNKLKLQRWMK